MSDWTLSETSACGSSRFYARLDSARRGSREAVGGLLECFREYLHLVAEAGLESELRPKIGASDLVQDSLLEAQRDFKGFRGQSEAELRAWLKRILLNNLLNAYRAWRTEKREINREVPIGEGGLSVRGSSTAASNHPASWPPGPKSATGSTRRSHGSPATTGRSSFSGTATGAATRRSVAA